MALGGIFALSAPQIMSAAAFVIVSCCQGHCERRMDRAKYQGSHRDEEWNSSRRATIGLRQLRAGVSICFRFAAYDGLDF